MVADFGVVSETCLSRTNVNRVRLTRTTLRRISEILRRACKYGLVTPEYAFSYTSHFSYYASYHELPTNGIAAFNLLHPTGDAEDPDSAVPLCCLHSISGGSPTMTTIPIPTDEPINLQTLTSSRSFSSDAYVDCGLGVVSDSALFTIEAWVMPCDWFWNSSLNPMGVFTIMSCSGLQDLDGVQPIPSSGFQLCFSMDWEIYPRQTAFVVVLFQGGTGGNQKERKKNDKSGLD